MVLAGLTFEALISIAISGVSDDREKCTYPLR